MNATPMRAKVAEQVLLIPEELLEGTDEGEILRKDGIIPVFPTG